MESVAQRLMHNAHFAEIYEHLWRPTFTRLFSLGGRATEDFDRALRAYLARPGERSVLDVACGPGNYTRRIADGLTGDGRCVGLDFSAPMLTRAVRSNNVDRAAFIRGDAHAIPFGDNTFDAVTCLAALYLIPDPLPVVDELVRVAKPGGEIVVFTSVATEVTSLPGVRRIVGMSGFRIFGAHEIVDRLRAAGVVDIEQSITGHGQYVLARKPR
ncbi:methyltransferase domain-containing protein [Gordonia jinghuaiqii]|uniref:Methyltransferase domain-containing protein n=1 Tax=Gordonia jinghuaiqii TaxID=2758710 RepID=A0A7D7R3E6_9ACTN|nr:methyltransferase domain-containing protein [Gordonia jinghuaiqii]MCR5977520.1 methyltransferase domain-containing protein [Gordonia jinghuaiqii]QMT02207.1 methyltransferase domain-containing protein [Gordonia jinghuaiqii]